MKLGLVLSKLSDWLTFFENNSEHLRKGIKNGSSWFSVHETEFIQLCSYLSPHGMSSEFATDLAYAESFGIPYTGELHWVLPPGTVIYTQLDNGGYIVPRNNFVEISNSGNASMRLFGGMFQALSSDTEINYYKLSSIFKLMISYDGNSQTNVNMSIDSLGVFIFDFQTNTYFSREYPSSDFVYIRLSSKESLPVLYSENKLTRNILTEIVISDPELFGYMISSRPYSETKIIGGYLSVKFSGLGPFSVFLAPVGDGHYVQRKLRGVSPSLNMEPENNSIDIKLGNMAALP